MNKVFLVCGLGLFLAGCNATVPVIIDLETRVPVVVPRSYDLPPPRYYGHRCATVWDNTRHGYVQRRICGNHIP